MFYWSYFNSTFDKIGIHCCLTALMEERKLMEPKIKSAADPITFDWATANKTRQNHSKFSKISHHLSCVSLEGMLSVRLNTAIDLRIYYTAILWAEESESVINNNYSKLTSTTGYHRYFQVGGVFLATDNQILIVIIQMKAFCIIFQCGPSK